MANTRIPHEFIESIIKSELGSQLRVLFWYIRNLYGWKKRLEKGYLEIKSYAAEAKKIGMHRQVFFTKIKELERMGFFKIVILPGTKTNSVTDISDKPCNRIQLHPVTDISYQRVIEFSYTPSPDSVTTNPMETTESSDSETLKQSLKQDHKNKIIKQEDVDEELIDFNLLKLKNYTRTTAFANVEWDAIRKYMIKHLPLFDSNDDSLDGYQLLFEYYYTSLKNIMAAYCDKETEINNPTGLYLSILKNNLKGAK